MTAFVEEIFSAFSGRSRPASVVNSAAKLSEDYDDALFFAEVTNREISCDDLEAYPDCIFGFSPDAFLYFLPGIFAASVKEIKPELLVTNSIIATLDRGNQPGSWDDFFIARWPLLTVSECDVTQKWLLWLSEFKDLSVGGDALTRAFDTLAIIASQSAAYPIAKYKDGNKA